MTALPFMLGEHSLIDQLPDRCGPYAFTKLPINGPDRIEVAEPERLGPHATCINPARFARLLNIANGVSYGGGMGMPEWVMLDCALLPACFIGWMTPAATLNTDIQYKLNEGLSTVENHRSMARTQVENRLAVTTGPLHTERQASEWVPTSEFCSIPRLVTDEVVGYSLYSLQRGLGVRAKALGLWVMYQLGIRRQIGVAQWPNLAAIRAHLRFGPLELIDPATPLHTKAGETMIYRLLITQPKKLLSMALGETLKISHDLPDRDDEWIHAQDVSRWIELRQTLKQGPVKVIAARQTDRGPEIAVRDHS